MPAVAVVVDKVLVAREEALVAQAVGVPERLQLTEQQEQLTPAVAVEGVDTYPALAIMVALGVPE
jgi:hypothetical protein